MLRIIPFLSLSPCQLRQSLKFFFLSPVPQNDLFYSQVLVTCLSVSTAFAQHQSTGLLHPTTSGDPVGAVVDSVSAGLNAASKHGFQVSGAPTSDSITAIKDISLAIAKALVPSADDEALAPIIDTVSSSIASGLRQGANTPKDVVVAAIEDAVPALPTANVGYAVRPLSVNSPSSLYPVPHYSSGLVYSNIPTHPYTYTKLHG